MTTDKELATAYLTQRYHSKERRVPLSQYLKANTSAVLTFPRRMILLRAGRSDIENAWSAVAESVIEAALFSKAKGSRKETDASNL